MKKQKRGQAPSANGAKPAAGTRLDRTTFEKELRTLQRELVIM